jgi:hypothetical protein
MEVSGWRVRLATSELCTIHSVSDCRIKIFASQFCDTLVGENYFFLCTERHKSSRPSAHVCHGVTRKWAVPGAVA